MTVDIPDTVDAPDAAKAGEARWVTCLWALLTAATTGHAAQYGVPVAALVVGPDVAARSR